MSTEKEGENAKDIIDNFVSRIAELEDENDTLTEKCKDLEEKVDELENQIDEIKTVSTVLIPESKNKTITDYSTY